MDSLDTIGEKPRKNRIGVFSLSKRVRKDHLLEIFGAYGAIVDVFLPAHLFSTRDFIV